MGNPLSYSDPFGLHHGKPHGQMGHGQAHYQGQGQSQGVTFNLGKHRFSIDPKTGKLVYNTLFPGLWGGSFDICKDTNQPKEEECTNEVGGLDIEDSAVEYAPPFLRLFSLGGTPNGKGCVSIGPSVGSGKQIVSPPIELN